MRTAKCRPQRGVQRGLPLALLGNFQRYGVLRLGKFPNKLRYFLRKYPAACRRSARVLSARRLNPLSDLAVCVRCTDFTDYTEPHLIIFPFRSVGGGAVVSVFKGSFAWGGRMQGLGEEYYPKHEGGDCSPNGVAARPCSRRKAPCLLRLCKRE